MLRTLLLMLISTAALSQTGEMKMVANPRHVASLEWMAGSWVQERGKEKVMEAWIGPNNGLLGGVNVSSWETGKISYEFLRIADTYDSMSYFASPSGTAPVEFQFKEAGDKRVVFENLAHDFPQRIIYWKDGELLAARIEGKLEGKERSDEWRFTAAKPGATSAPPMPKAMIQ